MIFQIFLTIIPMNFKKIRCEIQEYGSYQPCRVFIQNILAVQLTMTAKNTSSYFKTKFGVNQHDSIA